MRRVSIALVVVLACMAVAAFGIDVNGMRQPVAIPNGTTVAWPDSSTSPMYMATAYTIYGQDASDAFYVKCLRAGVADGVELAIPAGQSLLIPAPAPVYRAASGYWRHEFTVTAHADTVYLIPWVK